MILLVSYPFERQVRDAEGLIARYQTLDGWARALVSAGDVAVTVIQRFSRDVELWSRGVHYRFVADAWGPDVPSWAWSERASRLAAEMRPAVIHFHGLVFPMAVRRFRRCFPRATPILVQDHGGIHDGSPGFADWRWRALHRMGLRSASGFLFAERSQADPWIRSGVISTSQPIYEVPESSSHLVPSAATTSVDRRLPGSPAILWVGRLNDNKDPLTVLDGFERAAPQLPGAELTMAHGSDELLPAVRQRVARSRLLAGRVHLVGRVEPEILASWYESADLFVLASHHEGGAYALLEALSFGVTPVVTDIAGFRALTANAAIGAHFPVGDAGALAEALVRCSATDPARRRATIREHFARSLSWPAVARRAMTIYREAEDRARLDR